LILLLDNSRLPWYKKKTSRPVTNHKTLIKEDSRMTKAELVSLMASQAGISKSAAEKALKAFTDGITAALKKGDKVSLVGFGSWEVSKRAARKGRNPRTGAEINIKASKVPRFRAGRALKDSVN
jgi:DNA-binding protein HU-beta